MMSVGANRAKEFRSLATIVFLLTGLFLLIAVSRAAGENVKVGISSRGGLHDVAVRRMLRALSRARAFARENKTQVVPILKKFLQLPDEDLIAKIYDYHKRAETVDGKIDMALAAETIRDVRQAEGIAREIPVSQVFDFTYLEAAR